MLLPVMLIFVVIQMYYTFIDFYNFWQFKKALPILESISEDSPEFFGVNAFNEKYNTNLKPINKCYYVKNNNTEDRVPYGFWFRIESFIYIYIYIEQNTLFSQNMIYLQYISVYQYDVKMEAYWDLRS